MNRKVHVRFGGGPLEKYPYGQLAGGLSSLTLPPDVVEDLGLPVRGSVDVELADGSVERLPIHRVRVSWHGRARLVRAYAAPGGALIGMALLGGSRLTLDAVPGGAVRIEALSWWASG